MINNSPFLSICIPTFNRSSYLKICLQSIINQIGEEGNNAIEIIVSDNASTDNTEEIVNGFKKVFPNIFYSKNKENLGYDRNLDNAIRKAKGVFCWFLSDDEIVFPGSIKRIKDILIGYNPSYLCFDIRGNSIRKNPAKNIEYIESGINLLKEYGIAGGLISQNVIRRELYPENTEKYFGNLWIHLSIIYEIIKDRGVVILDESLIKGQRDECTWAKGGKALFTYTSLRNIILSWTDLGYPKELISFLINEFHSSFLRVIISVKIQGLSINTENLIFLFKNYKRYPFYLVTGIMILFIPRFFLILLKKTLGK